MTLQMIQDEYKLTRKKYKDELRTKIPSSDLKRIRPFEVPVRNFFTHEMIGFADDTRDWPMLVSQISGDLRDVWKSVRIFAVQTLYSAPKTSSTLPAITSSPSPSITPKRHSSSSSSSSDPRSAKKSRPIIRIRASDEEATISSSSSESDADMTGLKQNSRKSTPISRGTLMRTSFIQTSLTVSPSTDDADNIVFQPPSPSSPYLQEIPADSSGLRKIVICRCSCGFNDGTSTECKCKSREGMYLIPRKILRSRRSESNPNATELLVAWKAFETSGREYPASWIPMEPLQVWRSGVLMDYLVGRISYAK